MSARCTHDRCDVEVPHIHVGELEGFRYWRDGVGDHDRQGGTPQDEYVAELRKGVTLSYQMRAGMALAKFMEESVKGDVDGAFVDGFSFRFEANAAVDVAPVRELQGEMTVNTSVGPVLVVGHCDGLNGRTVHDQKLTEKIDAEKYLDSLQWRAYLVMFGAVTFVYDLFLASYPRSAGKIIEGEAIKIREYHRLPFYTYPGIRKDVERAVDEFARFLAKHVPERMGL